MNFYPPQNQKEISGHIEVDLVPESFDTILSMNRYDEEKREYRCFLVKVATNAPIYMQNLALQRLTWMYENPHLFPPTIE